MEEESEDSLDLLLDTLCKAFGGIILITLLIALMSQEANNSPAVPTSFKTQWLLEQQEISRIEIDSSECLQFVGHIEYAHFW